jgi:hypothetical protein
MVQSGVENLLCDNEQYTAKDTLILRFLEQKNKNKTIPGRVKLHSRARAVLRAFCRNVKEPTLTLSKLRPCELCVVAHHKKARAYS